MKNKLTILAALSLSLGLSAQALEYKEIKGFNSPESVFATGKSIYVSNVGVKLEPLAKDNDGYISKLDKDGNVISHKYITNLNAPKGMNYVDGVLYVVDIDTLKGFKKGKMVFEMDISGAVFLNDIVVLNKSTLLVSDTGTGKIHQVNLKDKKYTTFATLDIVKHGGPNGMLINKGILYVAGYDPNGKGDGIVLKIDLKSKKMEQFSTLKGALDGIAMDKDGNLLVSSWENGKGSVYKIAKNGSFEALNLPKIGGPADHIIDGSTLWIPKMMEDAILKVNYK